MSTGPSRVAIVGLGLIGSSLSRALLAAGSQVAGWDADPEVRRRARALGVATEVFEEAAQAVPGAEVVVLAVPVGALAEAAGRIGGSLRAGQVVTDVGSTKVGVAEAVHGALPEGAIFVPGHPIAGTERSGPGAGRAELFAGRKVVLCPADARGPAGEAGAAVERVARMWQAAGAEPVALSPVDHDRIFALVSHLPHAVAYALMATVWRAESERPGLLTLSAGGLADYVRIAASNPVMWRDVFLANRMPVLEAIDAYASELDRLRELVATADADGLMAYFEAAAEARRRAVGEAPASTETHR
jgi:cyclohexadieny/prephenate dehydrogenase